MDNLKKQHLEHRDLIIGIVQNVDIQKNKGRDHGN